MAEITAKIKDLTALFVGRAIRRLAARPMCPFTGSLSEGYGFFLS